MRIATATALLILFGIAAGESLIYYPDLPDPMASRFGAGGQVDGWMAKRSFFVFTGAVMAVVVASLLLPLWLMRRLPESLINLPNRDFWLAPERRAATLATIEAWLAAVTVATVAFFVVVNHLVLAANLNPPPRLSSAFSLLLVAFLGGLAVAIGWLFFRFRRLD